MASPTCALGLTEAVLPARMSPVLGWIAHGVHYALIGGGLLVVCALLAPTGRPRPAWQDRTVRLAALRAELAATPTDPRPTVPLPIAVALVSSTAAAGVHAAASPEHLGAGVLVAGFFVLSALAQLAWGAVVLTGGATRRVLRIGAVGNTGIIALWVLTRTVGLPFGLVPVEAVGAWDTAASVWEGAVVAGCAAALRLAGPGRDTAITARDLERWPRAGRAWLVASLVTLGVLVASGAPT